VKLSGEKHGIDLLLINPGSRLEVYQDLGSSLAAIEPPVWAGLMATYVRNQGFSVAILDANADDLAPVEVAQRVEAANPLLAAVVVYGHHPSASTQNMPSVGRICRAIRARNQGVKTLLVGGHVAALPRLTMEQEDVDFVCDGEGPYTFTDLLSALRDVGCSLENVRGLWYRDNGEIRNTIPAPLIMDLDTEMPRVAWDLLPMEKYRAHNWHCFGNLPRSPYGSLYTTLGCPFHCSFCCIQAPFKKGEEASGMRRGLNSYRLWNPDSVIAQIDILVNRYGVRNIKFADELFVLNRQHVERVCNLIVERGYDLNIWAYARVDTLKDGMLETLRKAGIRWLALGIEAASERVRDDSRKGITRDKIYRAVHRIKDQGIYIIGNFIFGLPEDDLQTMQETLDLALELNCEFANFYCAMAYPGSQLYETALRNGWPLPSSWSGYSQHAYDTLPLKTKYLDAAVVLRFRDDAFHTYYTSERYLGMIRKKFGPETVEAIQKMTEKRLRRKLFEESDENG